MAFIFELYRKHTGIGLGDDESMDAADDDDDDDEQPSDSAVVAELANVDIGGDGADDDDGVDDEENEDDGDEFENALEDPEGAGAENEDQAEADSTNPFQGKGAPETNPFRSDAADQPEVPKQAPPPITVEVSRPMGITIDGSSSLGYFVSKCSPLGAAAAQGIVAGFRIEALNGACLLSRSRRASPQCWSGSLGCRWIVRAGRSCIFGSGVVIRRAANRAWLEQGAKTRPMVVG